MINLSVNETKQSSLLARNRALILYISIWIFDFGSVKLPGLSRNGPQAFKTWLFSRQKSFVSLSWLRYETLFQDPRVSFRTHAELSFLSNCWNKTVFSPHVREFGFQNPGKFCLWNPESWTLESGIQLKESGIPINTGIQNPSSRDKDWNPVPEIRKSTAWNQESKTVFDSLTPYTRRVFWKKTEIVVTTHGDHSSSELPHSFLKWFPVPREPG